MILTVVVARHDAVATVVEKIIAAIGCAGCARLTAGLVGNGAAWARVDPELYTVLAIPLREHGIVLENDLTFGKIFVKGEK